MSISSINGVNGYTAVKSRDREGIKGGRDNREAGQGRRSCIREKQ